MSVSWHGDVVRGDELRDGEGVPQTTAAASVPHAAAPSTM
jgi:hypothetical protein